MERTGDRTLTTRTHPVTRRGRPVHARTLTEDRQWWAVLGRACYGAVSLLVVHVAVASEPSAFEVPKWLYPAPVPATVAQSRSGAAAAPVADEREVHAVPGSDRKFTRPQLRDYFAVPDWHPESHAAAPAVVMTGRKPDVLACGFCHLPDGAGRPENAAIAGLTAAYIAQQIAAFANGTRRSAWTATPQLPTTLMTKVAAAATPAEVAESAAYFSSLRLRAPRAQVVEKERVPRIDSAAWIHSEAKNGADEPLGMRLIEVPRDLERHELRDSRVEYVAYVPPGSVGKGRLLASAGATGTPACVTCHGADLRGVGDVPPIAGRSPTYLLRQIVAFRTGARASQTGAPMRAAVAALTLEDMIAAAAYAASLQP